MRDWIGAAAGLALCVASASPLAARQQDTAATRLVNDPAHHQLVITIGPVEVPAHSLMSPPGPGGHEAHDAHGAVYPPLGIVHIPFDGYLHSLRYDLVDASDSILPHAYLHHLNLNDPDHRELFLPIARRMVAVSKETPALEMPPELMGYPVEHGQHIVVSGMLHNPSDEDLHGVTIRVTIGYTLASEGKPEYAVLPFHLDVAFPAGEKSFDLPPGRHSWSNEGSPAVPGTILGIGAHYHDFVEHIAFEDVTAGEILWVGCPIFGPPGQVERSTIGRMYEHYEAVLGIPITPEHTYRVTVTYNNTTRDTIPSGGMGVVAGVFTPDDGVTWPALDRMSALYRLDERHFMREIAGRWNEIGGALVGDARYPGIELDAMPSPALAALTQACPWNP